MRMFNLRWPIVGTFAFLGVIYAFQRPFREYPGVEYNNFPLAADWNEKTEWAFARLMYPPMPGVHGRGFGGRGRGGVGRFLMMDWTQGLSRLAQGFPRSASLFCGAL